MQLLPWWNMKPTYLERFVWGLELDVTLAGRVPATDGQVVWQILIPSRFPINRCHFGLNKSYIWMLCTYRKSGLYPLLTLYPHLPFYTFQLYIFTQKEHSPNTGHFLLRVAVFGEPSFCDGFQHQFYQQQETKQVFAAFKSWSWS